MPRDKALSFAKQGGAPLLDNRGMGQDEVCFEETFGGNGVQWSVLTAAPGMLVFSVRPLTKVPSK